MAKTKQNRVRDFLARIRKGSAEEQVRLTWLLVIVFMAGIFFLWIYQAQRDFSQLAGRELVDASALPPFPSLPDLSIDKTLRESGEQLSNLMAESNEELEAAGDAYIRERDILPGEDFSSVKFSDAEMTDDEILLLYGQYYKDIPVLGCGLVLAMALDGGEISEKHRNLAEGIELAVDPQISLREAGELAEKEMADARFTFKKGSLAIARLEEDYYLAWRIVLENGAEGGADPQEILVGANHGGIISRIGVDDLGRKDELENVAG